MKLQKLDFNQYMNSGKIEFDASYQNACVKSITRLGLDWYHIDLRPDTWYRFNFRMKGCKGREIIFDFTCLDTPEPDYCEGRFRWRYNEGDVCPVISYDGKTWEKVNCITKVSENYATYRFKHTFIEDVAYVSHQSPYTYNDMIDWLETLTDNPLVEMESIGKTRTGVEQYALTITANKSARDTVYLIGREDADEPGGSFGMEGLMESLLNDKKYLLDNYVFKIVPMVGIDGVIAGATHSAGYGYSGYNWGHEKSPEEIENVKEYIRKNVADGYKIVLAGKLHGAACPAIDKGIDCYLTSDQKVLDLMNDGTAAYYNGNWQPGRWNSDSSFEIGLSPEPAPRNVGYFERFIMDEFSTANVFGTHVLEYLPHISVDGGKAVMSGIENFLNNRG